MVGRAFAFASVCLLVLAAPALAQDLTGPPLAKPATTLYAHSSGSGAKLWMSTIMKDPAGSDATVTMAFPGGANTGSTASFKLLPAPTGPVVLDKAQDIKFNIRFGSGLVANYGTVSTKLLTGTTVVASATGAAAATVSSYGDVKLTAKPTVDTLPAGQDITWQITFAGEGSAYIQVSQSDQWCNLVLPILSAGGSGNATANTTANLTNRTAAGTNTTANGTNGTATAPGANSTSAAPGNQAAVRNGTARPLAADGTATRSTPLTLAPLAGGLGWAAWRRRRTL